MQRKPAKSFQDLIVWQKAHQFALMVYKYSNNFPKTETYGLTSATGTQPFSACSLPKSASFWRRIHLPF